MTLKRKKKLKKKKINRIGLVVKGLVVKLWSGQGPLSWSQSFLLFVGFDGFQKILILILMAIRLASVTVSSFISLIHRFDWYS